MNQSMRLDTPNIRRESNFALWIAIPPFPRRTKFEAAAAAEEEEEEEEEEELTGEESDAERNQRTEPQSSFA